MLRQKDGAGVGNAFQAFFGHGKNANFIDGAKAIFDGPNEAEAAVRVAFKIQDRVDHVLQHAGASQCAFFGDMADQHNGGASGFGCAREMRGTFPDLCDRAWGRSELVGINRLNGVDDGNVRPLALQRGQDFFQLNFGQYLDLAVVQA